MTNFMFGYHNELIRASANRFVNDVDQRLNRPEVIRAATPPIVEIAYNPPAGVSPAAPITVWRFYGYDEPAQVHWLAFRRINAMLGGLLITEIGAEDHDKQVHMMGQETFWQGFGFNTSSNIASYTYNLGFDRWSQAIRLQPQAGETQENYSARMRNLQRNWEQSYAGLKLGLFNLRFPQPPFEVIPPQPNAIEGAQSFRFDVPHNNATFQDDPDTYLERRQHSPIPLPLPFSTTDPLTWDELSNPPQDPRAIELIEHRYLDEHVDMTGGILASLEGAMRVSYRDQSRMLWGIDPARPNLYMPWIANIWPQYYLRTEAGGFGAPGLNMLRLENHAAFFLNNRPKTATEMRLSYWMPLILGAKGLMIYKGPTSTEQGAEPPNRIQQRRIAISNLP
ncbi:MAG: hypothetical protein IPH49_05055 [Ignavibacteria bacterium]|nr:hypothetical protein [Ignavibacteria bacterium]